MSSTAVPAQAILVFPHLRVQNANAISSPLTHGFPSITAFTGLMWALQRKLTQADIALHLHQVGVICHHHQELVAPGFVQTFHLTRNPVNEHGDTAAIVEEGRIHLDITLVFTVSENASTNTVPTLVQGSEEAMQQWADTAGHILSSMRVASGTLLPSPTVPGRRLRPWLAVLPDDAAQRQQCWQFWRRQWLPGFALVARDDLLAKRWAALREQNPQATLLDAWLHASRFNYQQQPATEPQETLAPAANLPVDKEDKAEKKVEWADPWRGKGSGWIVPITVGYAGLSARHAPGTVGNARDTQIPVRFVESVYSLGEWISPHRLTHLEQLLWQAQTDEAQGLYRCCNAYKPAPTEISEISEASETNKYDDDEDFHFY